MSKNYTQVHGAISPQSAVITTDQVNILSIQIKNIVRYFKTMLFEDTIAIAIQKQVCKLNKVKHITNLTQSQYNNTMHYLQSMEYVMHQYYWCISFIEQNLLDSLMSRGIDNATVLYDRNKTGMGSNRLKRTQQLSKRLIDLSILKELY